MHLLFPFNFPVIFCTLQFALECSFIILDVRTAFLNGELEESVCIMSPSGVPEKVSECYMLNNWIYGLKRAHLSWHTKLRIEFQLMMFIELSSAPCVFQWSVSPSLKKVYVYVYDVLVIYETADEIENAL